MAGIPALRYTFAWAYADRPKAVIALDDKEYRAALNWMERAFNSEVNQNFHKPWSWAVEAGIGYIQPDNMLDVLTWEAQQRELVLRWQNTFGGESVDSYNHDIWSNAMEDVDFGDEDTREL